MSEASTTESLAPRRAAHGHVLTVPEQIERAKLPLPAVELAYRPDEVIDREVIDERHKHGALRGKRRYRCLVLVPNCLNLTVGHAVLSRGINTVDLFEDQIEELKRTLVADPEEQHKQDLAQEEFLRRFAKVLKQKLIDFSNSGESRWGEVPTSTIVAMLKANDPDAEFQEHMTRLSETTSLSPQAVYHELYGQDGNPFGMKPISELRVLEDLGVPAPTAIADQTALAATVAGAITNATANSNALTPEALAQALVIALRESGLAKGGK